MRRTRLPSTRLSLSAFSSASYRALSYSLPFSAFPQRLKRLGGLDRDIPVLSSPSSPTIIARPRPQLRRFGSAPLTHSSAPLQSHRRTLTSQPPVNPRRASTSLSSARLAPHAGRTLPQLRGGSGAELPDAPTCIHPHSRTHPGDPRLCPSPTNHLLQLHIARKGTSAPAPCKHNQAGMVQNSQHGYVASRVAPQRVSAWS